MHPEQEVSWCQLLGAISGENGVIHKGTLQQASSAVKRGRVFVLAPVGDVVLHYVDLPIRNRQRLRTAIPYALEELLISPVDEVHCALESRVDRENEMLVATVSHRKISHWLALLKAVKIHPLMLVPEQFCLLSGDRLEDKTDSQGELWLEKGQAYLLSAHTKWAMAVMPQNLAEMMTLFPETGKPMLLKQTEEAELPLLDVDKFELDSTVAQNLLSLMAANWLQQKNIAINLLQGEYRPGERWRQLLQYWKGVAVSSVILIVMLLFSIWSEVLQLEKEHKNYQEQLELLYRQAFPKAKRVVNPRLQLERKLSAMNQPRSDSKADFMPALEKISKVLNSEVFGKGEKGKLQIINFKEGVFDFSLEIQSLQHLDKLKEELIEKTQYGVEVVNASSVEGYVKGQVRVTITRSGS